MRRIRNYFHRLPLASKIQHSFTLLFVPLLLFVSFVLYYAYVSNLRYEGMIQSVAVASEFSLDFKNDFDYEIYLLIVGNKSPKESDTNKLLAEANRVVGELESLTKNESGDETLSTIKKYLTNLGTYKERIIENLGNDGGYEANMQIWENDVQIVTGLLKDATIEYFYDEVGELQKQHNTYQQFFGTMLAIALVVFLFLVAVILYLSYHIPQTITQPIRELVQVTDQVAGGDLSVRADIDGGMEVSTLSKSLNLMIDKINELLDTVKEEQTSLRKAEFAVLQSQINPHFLYNTLDAIVWLAESGEQKRVVSMVGSLSDFFRTALGQGRDIVTVHEEVQHVRSYLEIQQVRYQDILEYEIDMPVDLGDYLIPKITIQPLAENALYHGIKNRRGLGHITIQGVRREKDFYIRVSDNGAGMDEQTLRQIKRGLKSGEEYEERLVRGEAAKDNEGKSPDELVPASIGNMFGLYNVNERIRLHFGKEYGLRISSEQGVGTTVEVHLPYLMEKSET